MPASRSASPATPRPSASSADRARTPGVTPVAAASFPPATVQFANLSQQAGKLINRRVSLLRQVRKAGVHAVQKTCIVRFVRCVILYFFMVRQESTAAVPCEHAFQSVVSASLRRQYLSSYANPRQLVSERHSKSPPPSGVIFKTPSRRKAFVPKFLSPLSHFVCRFALHFLRSRHHRASVHDLFRKYST